MIEKPGEQHASGHSPQDRTDVEDQDDEHRDPATVHDVPVPASRNEAREKLGRAHEGQPDRNEPGDVDDTAETQTVGTHQAQ